MTFRILSWNILQGGGKRMPGICAVIEAMQPDIVVLQEYRSNKAASALHDSLDTLGLTNKHHASEDARNNAVIVASRDPIEATSWTDSLPEAHALRINVQPNGYRSFSILAAHLPHKKKQIPYFSALLDKEVAVEEDTLLLGDLNCGIPFEDSETKTFDNTHLFQALLNDGWIDSWRTRNLTAREFTWISPRGNGYRYDHCLATKAMNASIDNVQYLHEHREQKLSDHSPMLVTVN